MRSPARYAAALVARAPFPLERCLARRKYVAIARRVPSDTASVEDSGAVGGAAQGRLGRRERATWDRYGGRQARLGQYFARLLAFNPLNYGGLAVAATLE